MPVGERPRVDVTQPGRHFVGFAVSLEVVLESCRYEHDGSRAAETLVSRGAFTPRRGGRRLEECVDVLGGDDVEAHTRGVPGCRRPECARTEVLEPDRVDWR